MKKNFTVLLFSLAVFFITFVFSHIFLEHKNYIFTTLGRNNSVSFLFWKIFSHNYLIYIACLLSLFLGKWLIFISIVINMGQLGFILGTSSNAFKTFFMLIPHGCLEVVSIILMASLCWNGIDWVITNKKVFFKYFLLYNITLLIAAIIESIYIKIVS